MTTKDVTKTCLGKNVVSKTDKAIEALGKLDSLMCCLDKCRAYNPELSLMLNSITRALTMIGSEIAGEATNVVQLEDNELMAIWIDNYRQEVNSFLRFSKLSAIELNEARIRTRSFEVALIDTGKANIHSANYVNTLSLLLYYMAIKKEKAL
jgi:cob(I)alamin adenosyltransferase